MSLCERETSISMCHLLNVVTTGVIHKVLYTLNFTRGDIWYSMLYSENIFKAIKKVIISGGGGGISLNLC